MAVRRTTLADGRIIPTIEPVPFAHIALVHQPSNSSVYQISSGQVIEMTNGPALYCAGYAEGANRFFTMSTSPIQTVRLPDGDSSLDTPFMYAEWYDGQRADAHGNRR
jgi:hypothetical protein